MHSTEFTKPVTTESLLSAFESRFGQTLNLEGLDKTQLEDMANMVRTKIHTITDNSHFGKELKDDNYQKHQSMLDIVNQAVKESKLGEYGSNMSNPILDKATAPIKAKLATGQSLTPDERGAAAKLMASKTNENPLMALGGIAARAAGAAAGTTVVNRIADKFSEINEYDTPEKKAERDALMKHYLAKGGTIEKLKPGIAKGASHIDTRGSLKKKEFPGIKFEGIEQQSELILAAKDMMDKVTGYLEDLASMKTEGMLQLADRIRDEMGAEKADAFVAKILPAIESAEATLTQTRADLEGGVRILTGEETAEEPLGQEELPSLDGEEDLDALDADDSEEDEFATADANAGGLEPAGRAQRESKEVFETTNRIYSKLARK